MKNKILRCPSETHYFKIIEGGCPPCFGLCSREDLKFIYPTDRICKGCCHCQNKSTKNYNQQFKQKLEKK